MSIFATFLAHFNLLPFLLNALRDGLQVLIPFLPLFGTFGLISSLLLASLTLVFTFTLRPRPFGLPLVLALAFFFFSMLVVTSHHLIALSI